MGTFKFTGLSAGSAATDSANIAQVQNSFGSFLTVSGTDTITATVSPALTAYAAGQMFAFVAANTNTGAVTINISTLGAKAITKNGTTALSAGDLTANYLFVVVYDGTQFQVVGVSATTFTDLTISGVLTLSGAGTQLVSTGTGAWKMPVGTTGQRPASPASGMIRQNSTTGNPEWYDATTSSWLGFSNPAGYSVSYLVVAGGGGGGYSIAGGGGAGGLLTGTSSLSAGTAYTITIGGGGAGATTGAAGVSGSSSSLGAISTAIGGGGGGSNGAAGANGSSGGGGNYLSPYQSGGTGTSGQGFAGGTGQNGSPASGGGGGGTSAVGANGNTVTGGAGGAGTANSISGTSVTYGGGGGGGGHLTALGGAGGAGGGGAGGSGVGGVAATANTGGGGGGGGVSLNGGAGGSGIVIISYLGSQRGTGGTVTSSGGYTIHTFTSSGTYNA
jgi:hypothetical protein